VACLCQLSNRLDGFCPFRNIFQKRCFYLIAKFFFDSQSADVVAVGPAKVANRTDIDKADFSFMLLPARLLLLR